MFSRTARALHAMRDTRSRARDALRDHLRVHATATRHAIAHAAARALFVDRSRHAPSRGHAKARAKNLLRTSISA
jgi:hypothetical protein